MSREDTDASVNIMEDLEAVWKDALKRHGCVECARVDLAQQIRLMARAADWDIVGDQGEDGDPVLEERDGIRRICPDCQTPPPEGAIRFFTHGTDELLKECCHPHAGRYAHHCRPSPVMAYPGADGKPVHEDDRCSPG